MNNAYDSDLARKLNLKSGTGLRVVSRPDDARLDGLQVGPSSGNDALLVFVRSRAEAEAQAPAVAGVAASGEIAWMAYPKGGQLGTDLNRDSLAALMRAHGVRAVRQVSLDDVWSLLRFRPDPDAS